MCFRLGKVTRGVIGALSMSGLWLGLVRVIMTESVQTMERIGAFYDGVNWCRLSFAWIRCHAAQLRPCSEREVPCASL